ncbi:MAG: histone deacetylase [Pirellulaceae bacterium]|nr:MAG: histone deacetylase [Pirellulaceae bacterium]
MTLIYYDPLFLEHDTGDHPECADRLRRTVTYLQDSGMWQRCSQPPSIDATLDDLQRVHAREYLAWLEAVCRQGGGRIEIDTVVSRQSYRAACRAAGVVCDATRRVLVAEDTNALCLVRPPGHHARPSAPMGFCLIDHVAVAAQYALDVLGLDRVMIVDWDVHHGNGTQEIFWTSERVGFFSIHRFPFYPGTGAADETGAGPGLGFTCNVPIAFGTPPHEYHQRFQVQLESFAEKVQPQLIFVSAGFDAHRLDPIGGLDLEVDDFRILTEFTLTIAHRFAQGRIVSCLEGGYHLDFLPRCVAAHLDALIRQEGFHIM